MSQTRFHQMLAASMIAAVSFATTPRTAEAQTRQAPAATQSATPARAIVPTVEDAGRTREELEDLLRKYPVGRVLKIDPSLLRNDAYLASFPPLAEFLAQHPEIAHNPGFYFENVRVTDGSQQSSSSARLVERFLEATAIIAVFVVVASFLVWLIKTVLDQRRWNRLSRIQAEVHGKLMDRFSSNDELMAYVQTASGQRFLESGPSPLEEEPRALAAPVSRILWSLQAGVVITMGGLGMLLVSRRITSEPAEFFMAMGILGVALGAGFVVSAGVAYLLSRKLGLFDRSITNNA
jgi:hypothetical protein